MKRIIIFIAFLFLKSFNIVAQERPLRYINDFIKLEMTLVDDKCGEWGGNETNITIYRRTFKGPLLADYSVKNMNCLQKEETKIVKEKKAVLLNEMAIQLIIESIKQLSLQKINRPWFIASTIQHSKVKLSDSSLIIDDFSSEEWGKFKELCFELDKL